MHTSRLFSLAFAFAGVSLLGASRPTAAQDLKYTLSGVTFNDGAVATGFFNFNPTTQTFGNFDVVTTDGTTDGLVGADYLPATTVVSTNNFPFDAGTLRRFDFFSNGSTSDNSLTLFIDGTAESTGTFPVLPGEIIDSEGYTFSGEFAPTSRVVTGGSLLVTNVPEASTTTSLGLLLALGGLAVAVKRKKAVRSL